MANAWKEVDMIAAEALMHLEDGLVIARSVARDKTSDFMTRPNGYAVGDTVRIKTRPEYTVNEFTDGGNISVQDIRESTRSMQVEKHYDISVQVSAKEKALDLESFSEQVIQPAAYALAEQCDAYVGTKILDARGEYSSNSLFTTQADMAAARKAATLQQLDPATRMCLVDLDLEATLLGQSYFATWAQRGDSGRTVFDSAQMGVAMGMRFMSSINFPSYTHTRSGGTTATDNNSGAANLIGDTTLNVDAITGGFSAGDRIQIAGVRRPLIVASNAAALATTISLAHPIDEIIPDNAAVTVISSGNSITGAHGAIFDSQALAVAMPMLDPPSDKPSAVVSNNGYSIRVVQGYDMTTKRDTLSLDLLIGAVAYDARRITLLTEY